MGNSNKGFGFCFLCVGLAARYEELEMSDTACYFNVERQECPEAADAYAVDAFVPNKARAVSNILNAIGSLHFCNYIKNTPQLFAREFIYRL